MKMYLQMTEKSIIFGVRTFGIFMQITEKKIRQISEEALCLLGPNANTEMLKKVVREVVRRLAQESKRDMDPQNY